MLSGILIFIPVSFCFTWLNIAISIRSFRIGGNVARKAINVRVFPIKMGLHYVNVSEGKRSRFYLGTLSEKGSGLYN